LYFILFYKGPFQIIAFLSTIDIDLRNKHEAIGIEVYQHNRLLQTKRATLGIEAHHRHSEFDFIKENF